MSARSLAKPTAELALWLVAAALVGVAAVRAPLPTIGILAVGLLFVIPFRWLFAVLVVATTVQVATVSVGGFTVRSDELVVLVFGLRAVFRRDRLPVGWPGWAGAAFVVFLGATSVLSALDVRASLLSTGLVGFGVLAFLAVSTVAMSLHERISWLRIWLGVTVVGGAVGIAASASALAFGTSFGVTRLAELGGFPAATGVAFEHNLFGSSCAIAAIVLLGLWRCGAEHVLPGRFALAGFWVLSIATALSLTRGAWVAFACGVLVVFLVLPRPVSGRTFALVAVQGVGLVLLVIALGIVIGGTKELGREAVTSLQAQGERALEFRSGTGGQRTREWQTALDEVRTAPVFGFGANSFGQRHVERTLRGNIPSYLGNWVVRTLYDAGVIGLVLVLALMAGVVWPAFWLRHAGGSAGGIAGALVAGGVVLAVAYLAADGLLLVWPWVFVGLVWSWRVVAREEARDAGAALPSSLVAR